MKSELEKMLNGKLYNANDSQLIAMRTRAQTLFTQYNNTVQEMSCERTEILKELLGGFVDSINIRPPFFCDYGCHIFAGKNLYINFNCTILDCGKVSLGDNVFIGPCVQLYAASHPLIASERILGLELAAPILIGNNVWLGGGVIVCPGVTIGDDTTIGAGSVVTQKYSSPCLCCRKSLQSH